MTQIQLGKKLARVTHDTVRTSHGTRDLVVVLHAGFMEIGARRGKKYDLSYHDIYIAAAKRAAYKMLEQRKKEREEAKKARKSKY